ncbi:OsmC family protein [Sinomicrobium kalidii]|uniref:OsmC family protein n=1 Tax=Sinomicrobium kalidii TaxID=2900738 RepID=UPI001E59C5F2|nr:OsmC family protein [Sinomicrobium kalidii]UGU15031.1 OsmC family protein [Sinomicrobium kalidii]
MTSKVTYKGDLRTVCEHLRSGNTFTTDAPTDNNGKGEAFSPTDTVATALASCMLTVMGIKARELEVDLTEATAEVTKVMAANPRRISGIKIVMNFPVAPGDKSRKILEHTANTCPVHHSLHPDINKEIIFNWGKTSA